MFIVNGNDVEPLEVGEIYNGTLSAGVTQNFTVEIGQNVYAVSFVTRVAQGYSAPEMRLYFNSAVIDSVEGDSSTQCIYFKFPE